MNDRRDESKTEVDADEAAALAAEIEHWLGRAAALTALGQPDEAVPCLKLAIKLSPPSAALTNLLADTQVAACQDEQAITTYRRVFALDPAFSAHTGERADLLRAQSRLVCPHCHVPLAIVPGAFACDRCQPPRQFPRLANEIGVFFAPGEHGYARRCFGLPGLDQERAAPPPGRASQPLKDALAPTVWRILLRWLQRRTAAIRAQPLHPFLWEVLFKQMPLQGNSIYNYYMKVAEQLLFALHPPTAPSLEFGGNYGAFTNLVYGGRARITYSSEYLVDSFYAHAELPEGRHRVFDCLFGSGADRFPLPDASLRTVLSMHILDHVKTLDDCLAEAARVLRPGGRFVATTYTDEIALPEFGLLRKCGLPSERYRDWRLRRRNPRGGGRYVDDGDYATGRNLMALADWRALFDRHGFTLAEAIPYSRKSIIAVLMDVEYQGFYCPRHLVEEMMVNLAYLIGAELEAPPAYEEAQNVFLVAHRRAPP